MKKRNEKGGLLVQAEVKDSTNGWAIRTSGCEFRFLTVFFRCFILIYFLCCDSLKGNCFEHKSTIEGTFPDSSPIAQNKSLGWEPSTEKMTVRDGSMKGDVAAYLKLVGGGNHRCYFTTTYTYVSILRVQICAFC